MAIFKQSGGKYDPNTTSTASSSSFKQMPIPQVEVKENVVSSQKQEVKPPSSPKISDPSKNGSDSRPSIVAMRKSAFEATSTTIKPQQQIVQDVQPSAPALVVQQTPRPIPATPSQSKQQGKENTKAESNKKVEKEESFANNGKESDYESATLQSTMQSLKQIETVLKYDIPRIRKVLAKCMDNLTLTEYQEEEINEAITDRNTCDSILRDTEAIYAATRVALGHLKEIHATTHDIVKTISSLREAAQ